MNWMDELNRRLEQYSKEPRNPQLMNDIAVLLYQVNDLEYAEKFLKRAYEETPLDTDILYNYATVLRIQCKWKEAASAFEAYLEGNPTDEEAREALSDMLYALRDYEAAVTVRTSSEKGVVR